jgi:GDP-L-fucose synthase
MPERYLVTGGRGFLGRAIVRELEAQGHAVDALGHRDYDLTEQAAVRAMVADRQPDIVIHAAAAVGGIAANVAHPGRFLYENALMGLMLLEECRSARIERLVLISTTCAYPEAAPLPLQ